MITEVVMPQMGESILEGTITKWLKKVGQRVQLDEPLFEISTEKVDAEIPSPGEGVLTEIRCEEGQTVSVNKIVAIIDSSKNYSATHAPNNTSYQTLTTESSLAFNTQKDTEMEEKQLVVPHLPEQMRSLVGQLNTLIDVYETTIAKLQQEFDSAMEAANQQLNKSKLLFKSKKEELERVHTSAIGEANRLKGQCKSYQESALEHLQKQSVYPDQTSLQLGKGYASNKNSVVEAEKCVNEGVTYLSKLRNIKKPENHGNVFTALGVLGFVLAACAGINSSRGQGGSSFFLVLFLFLGLAAVIAVVRNFLAASEMKSQYEILARTIAEANAHIDAAINYANSEYDRHLTSAEESFKRSEAKCRDAEKNAMSQFKENIQNFKNRFVLVVNNLKKQFADFYVTTGFVGMNWGEEAWGQWVPATSPAFSACLGVLKSRHIEMLKPYFPDHLLDFSIPALVPFAQGKQGRSLLLKCAGSAKEQASNSIQSLVTKLLATVPPGKVKFTLVDPVGLGQNASGFMQLADYDESLVSGKAWTEPQHIERELLELTEHMETVIQKYLRNDFDSIEQYNDNAGEIAEAYQVLVVWDFPVNFSETAARRLVSVAENGPRCGVYTIIIMDTSAEKRLPHGFTLGDLERTSNVIEYNSGGFVWLDDNFKQHELLLDEPPRAELSKQIVSRVGEAAKRELNVQVPYSKLLSKAQLTEGNWWTKKTENVIEAPLGPHGANKIQSLTLGEKTAHHAIVVGRTGSGKSNLMHVIITSLGLSYSPNEIELYLIDFKQGVEFKPYALANLPHAKVIAIESEREFGISVLHGLDRELHRRGELFRSSNVNNITDYRKSVGQLPRILLLVDEFQEFFSQDDNISSQARSILDRLVRQGRSQGIHVMLGSQTLKGASDLPHSIISQMGVRIALQCTEADARQIMGDDNLVNRQLTRPGEAIYNPESGQVEANKLFQVALFTEQDRDTYLGRITELAKGAEESFPPPIIFEGNEPANIESCLPMQQNIESGQWPGRIKSADAWLGEPIAISPPIVARFRRQGGSNLLVVTRDEQQGVGTVIASLLSLSAQYAPNSAKFFIVNLTTADSEWNEMPELIKEQLPHDIEIVSRKKLVTVLQSLAEQAEERASEEKTGDGEIFLVFLGLHRARDLRDEYDGASSYFKSSDDNGPDAKALFAKVMREGPESGIHVIAWCDAYSNVTRIDRRLIGEFAMRVAGPMSSDDSQHVIDDSLASKLDRPHRAIFFDEERPGQLEKFRPYAIPDIGWLKSIADQLRARDGKSQKASGG